MIKTSCFYADNIENVKAIQRQLIFRGYNLDTLTDGLVLLQQICRCPYL